MFVYAAHIPHSPLLLPHLHKGRVRTFSKVRAAINDVAADCYARRVDSIIALTPEGPGIPDAFVLHVSPTHTASFEHLADFVTRQDFAGDPVLAFEIRRRLCPEYPVVSVTPKRLDSATGGAMMHIRAAAPNFACAVLPLTYALCGNKQIYQFGQSVRDVIENFGKRVAVISLGDLARSKPNREQEARAFDDQLLGELSANAGETWNNHTSSQIDSHKVIGFRPLTFLLGMLDGIRYTPEILNYEQKYGVGMGVIRFGIG